VARAYLLPFRINLSLHRCSLSINHHHALQLPHLQILYSDPIHNGDLACAIAPYYLQLWTHLKDLPQSTLNTFPINACGDFQALPPYSINDPCIRRSPTGWNLMNHIRQDWEETGHFYHSLTELLETEQVTITGCYEDNTGEFFTVSAHPAQFHFATSDRSQPQTRSGTLAIVMQSVDSSCIDAIGYHHLNDTLRINFCSGREYDYYFVPQPVWEAFLDAPSKGSFFNHSIKHQFECAQVR
jgi:hypothetical protein